MLDRLVSMSLASSCSSSLSSSGHASDSAPELRPELPDSTLPDLGPCRGLSSCVSWRLGRSCTWTPRLCQLSPPGTTVTLLPAAAGRAGMEAGAGARLSTKQNCVGPGQSAATCSGRSSGPSLLV